MNYKSPTLIVFLTSTIAVGMAFLGNIKPSEESIIPSIILIAYAILISAFLIALIVGFVTSQIKYNEDVEKAKFNMLETEGIKPCEK